VNEKLKKGEEGEHRRGKREEERKGTPFVDPS
jgi:hypothetical protein